MRALVARTGAELIVSVEVGWDCGVHLAAIAY